MIGLPDVGPNDHLLPELVYVTPSKINPWRGGRRPEDRYTRRQLSALEARGIDPATVEDLIVRDPASRSEMSFSPYGPVPNFVMPCPILERLANGSTKVLSPSGDEMVIGANGEREKSFSWKLQGRRRG